MFNLIYNCPTDPRVFVYKCEAHPWLGVTLNFAHRSAFRVIGLTYLPVVGLIVLMWAMFQAGLNGVAIWLGSGLYIALWTIPLCFYYYQRAARERAQYELFAVYNPSGQCVGAAERSKCHGNPGLIHRTSHIVVFNRAFNAILLQKRLESKDIQPGKWDTAVGGHLALGECFEAGATRELAEELGIREKVKLTWLFDAEIRNSVESENTRVFGISLDGPFDFQKSEISEVRFWTMAELECNFSRDDFTPNLQLELREVFGLLKKQPELKNTILE